MNDTVRALSCWEGCYDDGWQGEIVPEAFAHPAKVSRALIRRIYQHAFVEGWLVPGDVCCDPFGGIAGTALDAMWSGLTWYGVELEGKFVALGQQNIDLWNRRYGSKPGFGSARIVQGDSRRLASVISGAHCVLGSPPFLDQVAQQDRKFKMPHDSTGNINVDYGTAPGQLGAMPEGRFDAVVSSPPYEGCPVDAYGTNPSGGVAGKNSAAVTHQEWKQWLGYGASDGQLGHTQGDIFWQAAREIVAQCHAILRPNGMSIWICKDFVRKGRRIPFSDQWQALCEAEGFRLVCRHRAMLVATHGTQGGMFGEDTVVSTAKKSFFRRLAEKRGSPPIDFEDVICLERV